jgi:hypothetical protein
MDYFGWSRGAGDGMLHTGTPGETVAGQDYAGAAVTVHYTGEGIATFAEPSYQYHQDTPGFESRAEFDDEFGNGMGGPGQGQATGRSRAEAYSSDR